MNKQQMDKFRKLSMAYYHLKIKQEEATRLFELEKKNFYKQMTEFWNKNKIQEKVVKDDSFSVTKVQSVKLNFDVNKLKKKLTEEQFKRCTKKTYNVINVIDLINFLKSKGISYSQVKEYFETNIEVDQKEINKMSELGEIKAEDIEGCYETVMAEPYYKISAVEGKGDEEGK